mgnify:FL=1|jgi:hypothetical protein
MLRIRKIGRATAIGKHGPIDLTTVLTEAADVRKVVLPELAEVTGLMVPREMAFAPTRRR